MMRIFVFVGIGLGVLLLSMVGALAVQGNLTREGLSQAGLLCFVFPPVEQKVVAETTSDDSFSERYKLRSQEVEQIREDLKERRREYDARFKELQVLEERLKTYRRDLEQNKTEIDQVREQLVKECAEIAAREEAIEATAMLVKTSELDNLRRMAMVYEGMSSASAAKVLEKMGVQTTAKVLSQMDERKAAKILEDLPTGTAAKVSERLRNMVRITDKNS